MSVQQYEVGGDLRVRLECYGTPGDEGPAPLPPLVRGLEPVSPELVLVSPPALAEPARAALPEPEPFEEWLRRVRLEEAARPAPELDWEFEQEADGSRRLRLGGLVFAVAGALASAVPVALLVLAARR